MVTFFTLMILPLIKYKWSNKSVEKLSGIISGEICPTNEFKCEALHNFASVLSRKVTIKTNHPASPSPPPSTSPQNSVKLKICLLFKVMR